MHSSQKNPETLFPKRKKPRTHLATTTPPANNHHHNQTHHQQQPQETTTKRKRNTKNCQKLPPPIEEIAKKHKKLPETHQEEKPLQTHARGNHFKPTTPTRRSPQATDQQPQATDQQTQAVENTLSPI